MLLCQTNFTDFVRIGQSWGISFHPRFEQLVGMPLSSREVPIRIVFKAIGMTVRNIPRCWVQIHVNGKVLVVAVQEESGVDAWVACMHQ
jgi:hypothetical protein